VESAAAAVGAGAQARLHLIRFQGVLAPNAKLRALAVPKGQAQAEVATEAASPNARRDRPASAAPQRLARLLKRVFDIATCSSARNAEPGSSRSSRPFWSA